MIPRRSRLRAWLTLAAFAASLALPFAASRHLFLDDDAACEPGIAFGRSSAAALNTAAADAGPTHCALCHWQRAVSGANPVAHVVVSLWLEASGAMPVYAPLVIPADFAGDRPARAPPVSLA